MPREHMPATALDPSLGLMVENGIDLARDLSSAKRDSQEQRRKRERIYNKRSENRYHFRYSRLSARNSGM
jgi:hypothetical protein